MNSSKKTLVIFFILVWGFLLIGVRNISAASVTLAPIDDTFLDSSNPGEILGIEQSMIVGPGGSGTWQTWACIKFDISSIPEDAIINSATLKLYCSIDNGAQIRIHRISESGDKDDLYDGSGPDWSEETLTLYDGVTYYTSYDDSEQGNGAGVVWSFNVTNTLKKWIEDNSPNYGFLIESPETTGTKFVMFYSKECTYAPWRPYLEVEYGPGTIPEVPDYQQKDFSGDNDCAPTASACILGYWDDNNYEDHSYEDLIDYGDSNWPGNQTGIIELVDDLKEAMEWTQDGVYIDKITPGLRAVCNDPEYGNNYDFDISSSWEPSWNLVQSEIDNGRPALFTIKHPSYGTTMYHATALVGYSYRLGSNFVIIHDNWDMTPKEIELNWDEIISLFFTKVIPGVSDNHAPNTPDNEDPNDGATGVSHTTNLDWSCSDPDGDTVYYTVYFEKNDSSPDNIIKNNATGSYADPGTLDYNSHYYWKVKADDHKGGVTYSPVWDFTTGSDNQPPIPATNPGPDNGATGVSINKNLSWSDGGGATSFDVYFGTDSTPDSGEFKGNQTSFSYNPGTLNYSTTYYWRIDAKNSYGTTTGDVWYFTTASDTSDDPYEENDTMATAYDISGYEGTWLSSISGLGIQKDEDWYRIYVIPGNERVLVDCQFTHADGDIDLKLYNSSGNQLAGSTDTVDNEYIDYTVPGPGTYYIKIYHGDAGNTYDLWWDDIAPPDTTAPDTSITGGPSGTITYNDVTFTYTGSDNVTSTSNLVYSYKLDGYDSSWSSYTSSTSKSYSALPNGSYTFYVKAKDEAENVDPSPASRSFTVVAGRATKQILSVSSGEHAVHPSCSPDGTKISYGMYSSTEGFEIWVMNSDGSGSPQKIINDVFPADWNEDYILFLSSSWSPDGTKIAYTKGQGAWNFETLDIWTINSDGSGIPLQITTTGFALMPSWSPDGEIIAYTQVNADDDTILDLWLVNSDGTGTPEQITNSGDICVWPSWSPDGKKIAYTSFIMETGETDLWVGNSDGTGNPSKIVSDVFLPSSTDDIVFSAVTCWSPDGAKICYFSDGGTEGNHGIWVTNSDGSGTPQPITSNTNDGSWSPSCCSDGTKIVYSIYHNPGPGEYFSDLHMTDYLYGDDAFPAGNIVSPILNQHITGISDVIGTVTDNISVDGTTILSSFSSWTLEYGEGEEPETWTNIVTSSTSKSNELLASWDTSALALETYTLRLRATDGVDENVQSVTVLRIGHEPDITVTDSIAPADDLGLPFGEVQEGDFSEATVTMTNDGTADLAIYDIASANPLEAPFSIESDTCSNGTVPPGASCSLTVRFNPDTTDTFSDSFDIPSNDPDEDSVIINLSGTCTVDSVADFSADPNSGTAPLTVNFTDLSTGSITDWAWDFGDGGTSAEQNPSHIYNTTGAYTVSLTVTGPGGTDTETKIDYITVSTEGWEGAYDTLFRHPSDLTLLRQYRDEFLIKTTKGKLYTKLLYNSSEKALQVLLQNPELMIEAKHLIEANKDAVSEVLHGYEGVIYNTDEIVSFLKAYAKKAPPDLKLLAIVVEKEMLRQQRQGEKFLGFKLK